jgi:hypothetical protein
MLAMSVNEVPGWFVTIPPSGIGVPVAFTPGLVPHADVLAAVLGLPPPAGLLLADEPPDDPELPHPAAMSIPATATATAAARVPGARFRILT